MDSKAAFAAEVFKTFNCAQAVLLSHCEEYGLPQTIAKKISCGFGGGMGYSGETCGAVSGAIMLIGLKYGRFEEADRESKGKTYTLAKKLTDKFKEEFGSIHCFELIKYNLANDEEREKARKSGIFKELCPALVKRAVELAEELL